MRAYKKSFFIVLLIVVLGIVVFLSLVMGAKSTSLQTVIDALMTSKEGFEFSVIRERVPRTLFGLLAGASLGLSGCLMQNITRNPIADPSILGVNTGAALFVVIGLAFFQITSASQYILFGFLGAMVTALFVYGMAAYGTQGPTPLKLALSGAATSIALRSLISTLTMPDTHVMDIFRYWQTGSIGGASWNSLVALLPCFMTGILLAFALAGYLNTLSLGDEMATGLGTPVKMVRSLAALAGVLLCGATTALAGPIGFVGLMVPHLMRLVFGNNMYILLPFSALGGSILLLGADIIGRVVMNPSELEVGIVTAVLGAPVFIWIIRKARVKSL